MTLTTDLLHRWCGGFDGRPFPHERSMCENAAQLTLVDRNRFYGIANCPFDFALEA
jgi:hypothetical protein